MGTSASRDELFSMGAMEDASSLSPTNQQRQQQQRMATPESTSPMSRSTSMNFVVGGAANASSSIGGENNITPSSTTLHQSSPNAPYKIVIFGESKVGKTSFNRRLVGKPYQKLEKKTIGKNVFSCEVEFFQKPFYFRITDFSGQRHFINISTMNAKDAHVVIFVYDVTRRSTFLNISQWYQTAMEFCNDRSNNDRKIFLIVGNMIDQSSGRMVSTEEGQEFARENNMLFCECSAKVDTDLDKRTLLMIAKQLSDDNTIMKPNNNNNNTYSTTQQQQSSLMRDEWNFSALLRNDNSQTIPVTIVYSRRRSNLVIRNSSNNNSSNNNNSKSKNSKQQQDNSNSSSSNFMGIELSTTKKMHYCVNSKTILILDNDSDMEQRILWTCSIVSSDISFMDLIVSLVFEAKVAMIEISEFGSVVDVLTTYTKQCVFLKDMPSPSVVNQFQLLNTNVNLQLDLANFSLFQATKQKSRSLQIQTIFEPIKWTYGMISVLNLEDAWIGDLGVEILCNCLRLQCIFQLRELWLVNNEISEIGCNHLKGLFNGVPNLVLEQLDLSNNPLMRDQGCKRIVEVSKWFKKLRYLNMSNCGATNDVATLMIEVLNSNRKLRVNLSNSSINTTVADIILALPEDCLRMINFANNPIMTDKRISSATMNPKEQIEVPPTKNTTSKVILDQTKIQINRRIMNSVTTHSHPFTFHSILKGQERTPTEIRVFLWALEQAQRVDTMKTILLDINSLTKIEHPNCARYYGLFCPDSLSPPENICVVSEQYGVPLSYMLYLSPKQLTIKERMQIAYDVALGIQHIHSINSFHLNLSSDAVQVLREDNGTLKAKVTNYGLSKWIQKGYVADFRHPAYQSPELLKSKGKTGGTQKSDVFAFSILLWELWNNKRPYASEEIYYRNRKELLRQIQDTGVRPALTVIDNSSESSHNTLTKRLQTLMHKCWQHDAALRLDFKFICIALKDMIDSL